jgi:Ser/Thr protein kinase RdoA (MazF antagonist)
MKPIFPTTYSTLCATALASFLSEQYELGTTQCRFIVRGVGDTYLVETPASRFVLRLYRSSHRSLSDIQAETSLLTALQEAGVSVSYPIADKAGNKIQSFAAAEGLRYGVLFSYAAGQSVNILNEQQLRSLGHEMARFHNVSATIQLTESRWIFDLNTTLFEPLYKTKDAFAEDPEGYTWLENAAKLVQEKLSALDTTTFSTGYCHFDFLPKNFHFDQDNNITLFDFDFFGHGWLINDLMSFKQHLSLDVYFNRLTQEAADSSFATFLQAYREYRAVSEEELRAIPWLNLGFWLFYMGFHTTHDQFYPFVFQPAHLKLRTGLIRQLMEKQWASIA